MSVLAAIAAMAFGQKKARTVYLAQYGDEFFAGWKATPWETVKRLATWSRSEKKAVWVSAQELTELVAGFGKLTVASKEVS
jgi:hypothetical protein